MKLREIKEKDAIFVQDDDGHHYCIHKNQKQLFEFLLNKCIKNDYNNEDLWFFEVNFKDNMIGMSPEVYKQKYYKNETN